MHCVFASRNDQVNGGRGLSVQHDLRFSSLNLHNSDSQLSKFTLYSVSAGEQSVSSQSSVIAVTVNWNRKTC